MRIIVAGSGGREAAIVEVLRRSGHKAWAVPGNPGIQHRMKGDAIEVATRLKPDLVVFGPEQPLVDGAADELRSRGIAVFGPGRTGAQLEGSKAFMKGVATRAGVPTAGHSVFASSQVDRAMECARTFIEGYGKVVIKTDYLAAGKGVLVTSDKTEAEIDVREKLTPTDKVPHPAIVIEQPLVGPEVSVFAITDGTRSICLPAAQDFKRQLDGDTGPNTGGMGAWSPLPFVPAGFEEEVNQIFIQPTLAELWSRGIDYRGCLYAGLMLTDDGPVLLEYNIRFGDPDSQVVLMRLAEDYDFGAFLRAAADGDLTTAEPPRFSDETAVLVVAAAEGYPTAPRLGDELDPYMLDRIRRHDGVDLLTAGVAEGSNDKLLTSGGRVLNVIGYGNDVYSARRQVYGAMTHIDWPGMQYRKDIALPPGT